MNRREFVKWGIGAGASVLLLPRFGGLAFAEEADPHFFLLITLPYSSGLDSSYLFDARPLDMTAKNLIQNYRNGGEPAPWSSAGGGTSLATDITAPLAAFKPYFTVVNGVIMAANFDGHDQNINYLYTGDPFGGESFVPHLNDTGAAHVPLDAIQRGRVKAVLTNSGGTVPLSPGSASSLVASLRSVPPLDPSRSLFRHLRDRFAGASSMRAAFDASPELAGMLNQVQIQDGAKDDEAAFVRMIGQFFRAGAAKGAVLTVGTDDGTPYDTHDAGSASKQPQTYAKLVASLASIFQAMRDTPYDSTRSLMDVTTFLFAAEFGRTLRQDGKPMNATGTDHNPLSNSVLIGGKGIRGGLVIGASDFATAAETLSPAHLSLDRTRVKAMGRPFDFASSVPRADLPAEFKAADYLGFGSVINTIYDRFGVAGKHQRLIERNGAVAPLIGALRT